MGWSSDPDLAAVGRHFSLDQGSQRGEVRFTGATGCTMEPGMANLGELELQRAHRPRQRLPKAEDTGRNTLVSPVPDFVSPVPPSHSPMGGPVFRAHPTAKSSKFLGKAF